MKLIQPRRASVCGLPLLRKLDLFHERDRAAAGRNDTKLAGGEIRRPGGYQRGRIVAVAHLAEVILTKWDLDQPAPHPHISEVVRSRIASPARGHDRCTATSDGERGACTDLALILHLLLPTLAVPRGSVGVHPSDRASRWLPQTRLERWRSSFRSRPGPRMIDSGGAPTGSPTAQKRFRDITVELRPVGSPLRNGAISRPRTNRRAHRRVGPVAVATADPRSLTRRPRVSSGDSSLR
jgi:hypothetical protein